MTQEYLLILFEILVQGKAWTSTLAPKQNWSIVKMAQYFGSLHQENILRISRHNGSHERYIGSIYGRLLSPPISV